jgi:hypothetical protein
LISIRSTARRDGSEISAQSKFRSPTRWNTGIPEFSSRI